MTTYYILTPEGRVDGTTSVEPTNPAVLWTSVEPEDIRQTWDFTNSVWFWTKDALKGVAAEKRNTLAQADVVIDSISYPSLSANLVDWSIAANLARTEDPTAERSVLINTYPLPTIITKTNADLVALVDGLVINQQKLIDILAAVFEAIDGETVTTKAQLETAWGTLDSGYTAPSKLPTIAALDSRVTALETA